MIFLKRYKKYVFRYCVSYKSIPVKLNRLTVVLNEISIGISIGNRAYGTELHPRYCNNFISYQADYNSIIIGHPDRIHNELEGPGLSINRGDKNICYVKEIFDSEWNIIITYKAFDKKNCNKMTFGVIKNPKKCLCGEHNRLACCIVM